MSRYRFQTEDGFPITITVAKDAAPGDLTHLLDLLISRGRRPSPDENQPHAGSSPACTSIPQQENASMHTPPKRKREKRPKVKPIKNHRSKTHTHNHRKRKG